MSMDTVAPVVGRKFKMRGGGVACIITASGIHAPSWPFQGYELGDEERAMSWWSDGVWRTDRTPTEFDLVEMLPCG